MKAFREMKMAELKRELEILMLELESELLDIKGEFLHDVVEMLGETKV